MTKFVKYLLAALCALCLCVRQVSGGSSSTSSSGALLPPSTLGGIPDSGPKNYTASPKVTGGIDVKDNTKYPWVAFVKTADGFCTGSLVAKNLVRDPCLAPVGMSS